MLTILFGIAVGFVIQFYTYNVPDLEGSLTPRPVMIEETDPKKRIATVLIRGDGIEKPGTYELSPDSTVIDLVKQAGGLTTGAITETIDWHTKLYDGLRLSIPTKQTLKEVRDGNRTLRDEDLIHFRHLQQNRPDTRYVNINKASAKELKTLSGIGDVLAQRIIDYREKKGRFRKKRELRNVLGIGDITYQELRSKIELW